MKKINAKYAKVAVKCMNCNSTFIIGTTISSDFTIPICGKCHPVYRGETHAVIDTSNRISKFNQKLEKSKLEQQKRETIKLQRLERENMKVGVIQKDRQNKLTLKDLLSKAKK